VNQFRVLSRAANKEEILAQVVGELDLIENIRDRSNLTAATSILAGLQLGEQTIRRLMRSPVMLESTMYQSILREGQSAGEQALVLKQLTRKFGNLSAELISRVRGLSLERLEALGEALLDFTSVADLESWLG
jgi:predicted transposase YdaD